MDKIKEWLFHKAISRAVETVAKYTVAYLAQPQIIALMDKVGIHVDPTKFGTAVTAGLLFGISWVYHLYVQYKLNLGQGKAV